MMLLCAALAGCSSAPRFNDHFGETVRANLSAQVIDPAAAANGSPAAGIDGAAARAAQERYQRSFQERAAGGDQPLVGRSSQP
jgi:hypothetical protein